MVIDVDDYDVFMKYIGGLAEYIRKELKLFIVETIEDAIVKAIAIEAKNKRADKRDDKQLSGSKSDGKKKNQPGKTIVTTVKSVGMSKKNVGDYTLSYSCRLKKTVKEERTRHLL
ncbi:hypothetical protein ACOSQ2_009789 [Xanthoceras sorbifolium]